MPRTKREKPPAERLAPVPDEILDDPFASVVGHSPAELDGHVRCGDVAGGFAGEIVR